MTHADWLDRIDAYETLDAEARAAVLAHAGACAECAAALAAWHALRAQARALPREIAPRRDLWPAIVAARGRRKAGDRRRLVRAGVAVAVAAACVAAAVLVRAPRATPPSADPPVEWGGVDAGLARICMGAGRALQALGGVEDGAAAGTLAAALAVLDRSIAETEIALEATPGDPALAALLTQRYRQKLGLLQAALLRAETT